MDEKLLTDKTVLEWLTLDGCSAAACSQVVEGGQVFPCGLALMEDLALRKPMPDAGLSVRRMHERHHLFAHRLVTRTHDGLWGFTLWPGPEGFVAECADCDPFPEMGLEYDRGEMEAMLPPW